MTLYTSGFAISPFPPRNSPTKTGPVRSFIRNFFILRPRMECETSDVHASIASFVGEIQESCQCILFLKFAFGDCSLPQS